MRVYAIRHGESENNLSKKWTGWMDVQLTDKGRDDAKKAGEYLKGISFDRIYSSDLIRARHTAEMALPGCSYETWPLLREIHVGNIAGQPLSVLSSEQRANIPQDGYVEFGGESQEQFKDRIRQVMDNLVKLDCQNVALFAHAGWIRGMLDAVIGVYLPRGRVMCNNCTIAVFEYTNEIWKLHSWINI